MPTPPPPTPSNQTVLITGASAGIGLELAKLFATGGYNLVLVARSAEKLETIAEDLRTRGAGAVQVCPSDLARPEAPQELFDLLESRKTHIDILVNNAGFGSNGPFDQADLNQQLGMLQVNIHALTHLARLFLPAMVERGYGRIMNLASVAAFVPGPMMAVYYASKAYVLSFSIALSAELKKKGVTVTAVCPGPTQSEFKARAGIAESPLFASNTMTAAEVAEQAYSATLRGKPILVNGGRNKLIAQMTRIMPRMLLARAAMKLNQGR